LIAIEFARFETLIIAANLSRKKPCSNATTVARVISLRQSLSGSDRFHEGRPAIQMAGFTERPYARGDFGLPPVLG
jgi:hypothetical protein